MAAYVDYDLIGTPPLLRPCVRYDAVLFQPAGRREGGRHALREEAAQAER